MLYELFGKIWEEEEMPTEWIKSHIIKLCKKGNIGECKNYIAESGWKDPKQSYAKASTDSC